MSQPLLLFGVSHTTKLCTFGNRLRKFVKKFVATIYKKCSFQDEWSVDQRKTLRPARSRGKKASKTSSMFRFPGLFFLDWPIVRPLISRRHELMKMFQDKIEKVCKKNEKKQKIIKKQISKIATESKSTEKTVHLR